MASRLFDCQLAAYEGNAARLISHQEPGASHRQESDLINFELANSCTPCRLNASASVRVGVVTVANTAKSTPRQLASDPREKLD